MGRDEMLTPEWRHKLNLYAAKGGKTSRRNTVARIERFLEFCQCHPEQVGRRHVHEFFEKSALSKTTARDYWYAIKTLWGMLGRDGEPPKPPKPNKNLRCENSLRRSSQLS